MSYYERHLLVCTNLRDPDADRQSCGQCGAMELVAYAKKRAKKMGITGEGKVRINKSGCMDRCEEGPVCVVYPDAVWYTWVDETDLDEIIDSHLVSGEPVERLRI